MRKISDLEEELYFQLRVVGLEKGLKREFKFHESRKWQVDFAWPDSMLIVEVEGGVFKQGRHTRGEGFEKDAVKYNAAVLLGYRVLRYSGKMVKSGMALKDIERALARGVRQSAPVG